MHDTGDESRVSVAIAGKAAREENNCLQLFKTPQMRPPLGTICKTKPSDSLNNWGQLFYNTPRLLDVKSAVRS
jgi:hypothetical protein